MMNEKAKNKKRASTIHIEKHHKACDELIQGLLCPELSWSEG
jgi:hypothetical protein